MKIILKITLTIACLLSYMAAEARPCGACHGKGWLRVFIAVSNFGLTGGKARQCPHCGKWVNSSDNHYCKCKNCGGTGEIGKNSSGGGMLYPSEEENVRVLLELINFGEAYYPDCTICKGSGKCPTCKGAGGSSYYDWDTGRTYGGCIGCGDSGICPTCRGGGKQQVKAYRPISQKRREQCLEMLRTIMLNAAQRTR